MASEYAAIAFRRASDAAAREDRARNSSAITTAAISNSRSHGQRGVPDPSADAPDPAPPVVAAAVDVLDGVEVTVVVCVLVDVEVCVDVWVDVRVEVFVDVCVLVDVSVVVDVVCVDVVRVGNVRVALGVGPRDGSEVWEAGIEIVRDAFGRLLPPPQPVSKATMIAMPMVDRIVVPRVTFNLQPFSRVGSRRTLPPHVARCE